MIQQQFDVAIIGAGPGGCAAALTLRNSGLKVALIDRSAFPRDKVCGDAIPVKAFKGMDYIDAEWGRSMRNMSAGSKVLSAALYTPNKSKIIRNWSMQALNVRRADFDQFLMHLVKTKTGTTVIENRRLLKVTVHKDHTSCIFSNELEINAGIVLGCDGANSVVVRNLASFALRGKHVATAVRAYVHGITGLEEGVNEVHLFKEIPTGYFWIFPLTNGWANVGFGEFAKSSGEGLNQRLIMQQIIEKNPTIKNRFIQEIDTETIKGFALPLGIEKRKISGDRFMLCGDAATLIDPIGGNGIDNAIWSGIFAAEQSISCFQQGNFSSSFMEAYDEKVYKKLGPQLRRSTTMIRLIRLFPWVLNYAGLEKVYEKIRRFFENCFNTK